MSLPLLPSKDPYDVVPYSADFSALLEVGDSITSATILASPSGLTISTPIISNAVVTAFVSGGTINTAYAVAFEIISAAGWHVKRSGTVPVKDR